MKVFSVFSMTKSHNIRIFADSINNYNNNNKIKTRHTKLLNDILLNVYIPTKVCNSCRTIKYVTIFNKYKYKKPIIILSFNFVKIKTTENIFKKLRIKRPNIKQFINEIKKN